MRWPPEKRDQKTKNPDTGGQQGKGKWETGFFVSQVRSSRFWLHLTGFTHCA